MTANYEDQKKDLSTLLGIISLSYDSNLQTSVPSSKKSLHQRRPTKILIEKIG